MSTCLRNRGLVSTGIPLSAILCMLLALGSAGAEDKAPASVEALWADIDPGAEPLDVRSVRQWEEDGLLLGYVTFHVGTFKGRAARIAAFYGRPRGDRKLPGLLHLHGGGQRAFLHEVKYYARRGYACLSINWGGREMEGARPGDPNTDWGRSILRSRTCPAIPIFSPAKNISMASSLHGTTAGTC